MEYTEEYRTKSVQIPDVSGYKLGEAMELLRAAGFTNVVIKLTAPPRLRETGYDDNSRVARQSVDGDGTVNLVVCNMKTI